MARTSARQTSSPARYQGQPLFIETALKGKKSASAADYAISYNPMSVVDPDVGYSVGNPVTVKIGVSAEVPKGRDDAPTSKPP